MQKAPAYPYSPTDDKRIDELMTKLQKIRKVEEATTKELRQLIYKVEKPR